MTAMIEKVARVIHEEQRMPGEALYDQLEPHQQDEWISTARAALMAMREPDEGMVRAAAEAPSITCDADNPRKILNIDHAAPFTAMIDHALRGAE